MNFLKQFSLTSRAELRYIGCRTVTECVGMWPEDVLDEEKAQRSGGNSAQEG